MPILLGIELNVGCHKPIDNQQFYVESQLQKYNATVYSYLTTFIYFILSIFKLLPCMPSTKQNRVIRHRELQKISKNLQNNIADFTTQVLDTLKIDTQSTLKDLQLNLEPSDSQQVQSNISIAASHNTYYEQQLTDYLQYNFHRKQSRYQQIKIPIPKLQRHSPADRQKMLRKWLGFATKQIFSIGFNYFEIKELEEKDIKVYCSENLLNNIIRMARINKLTTQEILYINETLRKQLLPYYSLKYPHSTQPEVNLAFANKIVETDNFNLNDNDLIFRSQIKFEYQADANYNPDIMRFLNFLLDLYQKKIVSENGKEYPLAKLFQKEMLELFQEIQNEKRVKQMSAFDPKMAHNRNISSYPSSKDHLDEDKYRQKVQAYTDFLIGRKISKDVRQFSPGEIKEGSLKLKIPSLMRIVTKWCSQLKNYFDNDDFVLNRSEQFRMRDRSENFLNKTYREMLRKLLRKQNQQIQAFMQQVNRNNNASQMFFTEWLNDNNLEIYSQGESSVGLFSSAIRQNYQFYQLAYLNKLIHGLLSVNQQFMKILILETISEYDYQKYQNGKINFDQLVVTANKYVNEQLIQKYKEKIQKKIPEFISFKIGDLLRCRCFSKQKQIIALYCFLEECSFKEYRGIKIIRVKNKLEKGTKDILMNIMYYNSIVIEVQLGINEKQSEFSICASKFQHYIYELQRSSFGPISEMCNIWWTLDERGRFYRQKLHLINRRKKIFNVFHVCDKGKQKVEIKSVKSLIKKKQFSDNYQKISLPFLCEYCDCYYFGGMSLQNHHWCLTCKKHICFLCFLTFNLRISSPLRHIEQELEKVMLDNEIPEKGQLLNLKSKYQEYKLFTKVEKDGGQIQIFEIINAYTFQFKLLKTINTREKKDKFLRENILLKSPKADELLKNITNQCIYKYYQIPENLRKAFNKKMQAIALVGEHVSDELFANLDDIQCFSTVTKLSLEQNDLTQLTPIFKKFKFAQIINLKQNMIEMIPSECEIMENLTSLDLSKNRIRIIHDNIKNLDQLTYLDLSENPHLDYLPNCLTKLKYLQKFYINKCFHLPQLPLQIGSLSKLKQLEMEQCISITKLPVSFCLLSSLTVLKMRKCTNIKELPKEMGRLKKLTVLDLSEMYSLEKLPPTMYQLKNLKSLHLNNCEQLQQLPENLKQLNDLQQVEMINLIKLEQFSNTFGPNNKLTSLTINECFCNNLNLYFNELSQLKQLKLEACCNIESLPQSIGNLKFLKKLNLNGCTKLERLPQCIRNLKNLEQLDLEKCFKLQYIPPLSLCENMKQIFLGQCYSLQNLPEDIGCLRLIRYIQLFKNYALKSLPFTISNYLMGILIEYCLNLKELPNQFVYSDSLESVKIKHCLKLQRLCGYLPRLKSLKYLVLENCPNLAEIDESIINMANLQVMVIQKCHQLNRIPKICRSLKLLKIIFCAGLTQIDINEENSIRKLQLQFCQSIQSLLTFERLQYLSQLDIIYCTQLKTLKLNKRSSYLMSLKIKGCHQLMKLPQQVQEALKLMQLRVEDCCKMQQLGLLSKFQMLSTITLDKLDNLQEIPVSIGECMNLNKLQISYCHSICELPNTILNLNKLEYLFLKHNKSLKLLPNFEEQSMMRLKQLQIIDCEKVQKIEGLKTQSLLKVTIEKNQAIAEFSQDFSKLPNAQYLNLISLSKLENLPSCFSELQSLIKIRIKYCPNIHRMPQKLFDSMKNLKYMTISHCSQITSFPNNFDSLKSLQVLQIRCLQSLTSLNDSFCNIQSLRVLKLIGCERLHWLPQKFGASFDKLQLLIIMKNKNLTKLPDNLGKLTSLEEFCLRDNPLMAQIPSLEKLTSLQLLDFKGCPKISNLPEFPKGIQVLQLGSGIKEIPANIKNMQNLFSFAIYEGRELKTLPSSFGMLDNLSDLVLRHCCQFQHLPEQITNLSNLKMLELSMGEELPGGLLEDYLGKQIGPDITRYELTQQIKGRTQSLFQKLPSNISGLRSLQRLYLRQCNYLLELPEQLSLLSQLKVLDLTSAHRIKKIPISKDSQIDLKILICKECRSLQQLPEKINEMKSLQRVDLRECSKLGNLPFNFGRANKCLKYLNLSFCSRIKVLPLTLKLAGNLTYLNLCGLRKIVKLSNDFFENLKNMEELYFEGCHQLSEIPSSIKRLRKLKKLLITNCKEIRFLPSLLNQLLSLQQLQISDCPQLEDLGQNFGNITSLKSLKMSKLPKLKEIPDSFKQFLKVDFQELKIDQSMNLNPEHREILQSLITTFIERRTSQYAMDLVQ